MPYIVRSVMLHALRDQLPIARAALFSWRTGPLLWSLSIGAACYFILAVLHAFGGLLPARVLSALELYSQVLTVIGAIALAVQALTMANYMSLNDEFMRTVVFKRLAIAAFATILAATVWSLLADMGWAPSFEPI